tara:strand:+ start:1848 stop:3683 length:1836 start_codon:yes stop_codon:yes gene_type:complete
MSIYFKKQIYIYFFGIFIILNNSCETFDDLQFDNLALRGQIDSLSQRITVLSEEILEQKRITSNLTEQVSDNDQAITETSDLLEEAITDVNSLEDNLETISEYVGQMIEESGDLSGDLNNLLNQVNELDEIIEGVNSTIVNIEGNLHAHEDTDNDGITNAQDTDDDNDGTPDSQDAFPEDPDETTDTDNDGSGNNVDDDDDGDGISDQDEQIAGTDPLDSDTDDDGVSDQQEQIDGTDPLVDNTPNENNDPNLAPNICNDCPQKIPGKDIFIAGTSEAGGSVYWVNGQKNSINTNSFASDIAVSNGKIFVSGYTYGSVAHYWQIDGQNITQYDLPGFEGEAQSIVIHNSDVYIGGYYSHADGMSGAYSCYWKNGVKYDNSPRNGDHASFGIAISTAGNVFLAGYYLNNHHYVLPAYWNNNQRSNLSRPNNQSDGEAVTVQIRGDGKRVFGGLITVPHNFLGMITRPAYWVGSQRNICNIGSVNNGWQNSGVHGLDLDGNNVYQAGWVMDMDGQYPTYWKNQQRNILQGATVNGTQYNEGKATDIAIVDGNIVVVGMLTGDYLDSNNDGIPDDYGYGPEKNNDTGYPCIWINGTPHVLDTGGDFEVGGIFIR